MAKAIDFPFRIEGGQVATTTDYRRIVRAQVIDAVTTNYRERLMDPEYGADIQSVLFDPSDELRRSDAANVISTRLMQMVPKVSVASVSVEPDVTERNLVYIKIGYLPSDYDDVDVLTIPVNTEFTELPALPQTEA